MGQYEKALNAVTYIKTSDGVLYKMDLNGLKPFAVTFFANNKGFTDGEVHFPFFDAEGNPNGFKFERFAMRI